jgi:hypothetical protein
MQARFEIFVERYEGEAPDLDKELKRLKREFHKIEGVTDIIVLVAIGDCIPTKGGLEDV